MKAFWKVTFLVAVALVARVSAAAPYPDHPITLIVPYAAGGPTHFFAETAAKYLTQYMGQKVIVEPRPGAGGNIASAFVAKARPDGYTLLEGTSGSNAVNPSLYPVMLYDAEKELRLIAPMASVENVLVVGEASPFKSVKDIIAYGQSHPGELTYASSGVGSVLHLSGAMFGHMTGMSMVHVPYSGEAPALIDVIGGRVNMLFANAPTVVNLVKSGKLRALAVTGKERAETLPDVPTMEQAGVPGFVMISWFGVMGPYKTPPDVITKLNQEIGRMLAEPEVKARFLDQGSTPLIMGADQAEDFFLQELKRWKEIVKISGAQIQ
ncbi:MAG: Bug family tripartite tricarboxylate transporter substrate binding protein [Desulfobaccales bacterium]